MSNKDTNMLNTVSHVNDGGGLRYNTDKVPLELVPPSLTFAVAEVLAVGAKKYAPRNWERGMKWTIVMGCLLRHLYKWMSPLHTDVDKESGLNHMYHVAANVAMLIEYEKTCKNLDDRVKYNIEAKETPRSLSDIDLDDLFEERCGKVTNEVERLKGDKNE